MISARCSARVHLVLAGFIILLFSSPLVAKPIVILLDNSKTMGTLCDSSQYSYLSIAQTYLKQELERSRSVKISKGSLYTFSDQVRQQVPLTRQQDQILNELGFTPGGKRGELAEALQDINAQSLSNNQLKRAKLTIVSNIQERDLNPRLAQSISSLVRRGWEVEILFIGNVSTEVQSKLSAFFSATVFVPCGNDKTVNHEVNPSSTNRLKQEVSKILGLSSNQFRGDTNFVTDLGFDRMRVYEMQAQVCGQQGVDMPVDRDLATFNKLAKYIAEAEKVGRSGITVRGGKKTLKVKEQEVEYKTVYFGTNRQKMGKQSPIDFFSGDRAKRGTISYGECEVSIPVAVHKRGALESPALGLQMLADPRKHIVLQKITTLSSGQFFSQVRKKINAGAEGHDQSKDILIFIHGYNVRFESAARRTAQVAYDLEFKGLPMFFSWPSDGEMVAYISDREDVEWSVPHIQKFLVDVVEKSNASRIHLITHSMGHEGLFRALNLIAVSRKDKAPLFENIIMAAPDFDAQIFSEQLASNIKPLSKNWTLYASDKDMALNVSAGLRFASRLGLPLTVVEDIVTVDATGIEVTPWSVPEFHSYFATKQRVITDIIAVLKGEVPAQRKIKKGKKGRLPFWKLAIPK